MHQVSLCEVKNSKAELLKKNVVFTPSSLTSYSMTLFSKGNIQRSENIYITPNNAYEKLLANKVRIVDVREEAKFKKYHIKDSINFPATVIRTKSFLRKTPLVLVSDGTNDMQMELLVASLQRAGFSSVKILDGGINRWQSIADFEGDETIKTPFAEISALDLMVQKKYQHWIVLDLLKWSTLAEKPGNEILDYLGGIQKSHAAPETRFVITTKAGTNYLSISKFVNQLGWSNVFYLRGGQQAYAELLKRQQIMWGKTPGKQGGENRCGGRV